MHHLLNSRSNAENLENQKTRDQYLYTEKSKHYFQLYQKQKNDLIFNLGAIIVCFFFLTPFSLLFTWPLMRRSILRQSLSKITMTKEQYEAYKDRNKDKIKVPNKEPKPIKHVIEDVNTNKVTLIMDEAQYQRNKDTMLFFQKNQFKDPKNTRPIKKKTPESIEKSKVLVSKLKF